MNLNLDAVLSAIAPVCWSITIQGKTYRLRRLTLGDVAGIAPVAADAAARRSYLRRLFDGDSPACLDEPREGEAPEQAEARDEMEALVLDAIGAFMAEQTRPKRAARAREMIRDRVRALMAAEAKPPLGSDSPSA
jgi:hypothetical protein